MEFSLNVYNIKKELTPYTECKINPHYVTIGNGRYYLIGIYDGSEKIYFFRVDLMTEITIINEKSVKEEIISELRGLNLSEYMHQHPYMISGEVSRMKNLVNKDIFTQITDWFGMDVEVRRNMP